MLHGMVCRRAVQNGVGVVYACLCACVSWCVARCGVVCAYAFVWCSIQWSLVGVMSVSLAWHSEVTE